MALIYVGIYWQWKMIIKKCVFFNSYQGWLATISKTHVYGKTSSADAIYAFKGQ